MLSPPEPHMFKGFSASQLSGVGMANLVPEEEKFADGNSSGNIS